MNVLQLLQLLVSLGPQFATVWKLIVDLIQQHKSSHPSRAAAFAACCSEPLKAPHLDETEAVGRLSAMHAEQASVGAPAFNWQILLQVFAYLQQHPELLAAVKAIIDAFRNLPPAPTPQPAPAPAPSPAPAAI
jgi:hypothetical protein